MTEEQLQITDAQLNTAYEAAMKGGNIAQSSKATTSQEQKQNNTIVTDADKKAEKVCANVLHEHSLYPVIGEESASSHTDADSYWIVDPIDGTNNFAQMQPLYGTAVALIEDNTPVVGVFYMPELEYVFYAAKDKGAYRNRTELSVSSTQLHSEATYTLSGVGRNKLTPHISQSNRWIQQFGCAIMSSSWVSSGWIDVGVFGALAPWDIATGYILVEEAGGVTKTIEGSQSSWKNTNEGKIVFGNESVVDSVLDNMTDSVRAAVRDSSYSY